MTVLERQGERRPLTRAERLTAGFYAWERRGRGWAVWPEPVELEPPFRPFVYEAPVPVGPASDDGRRHTRLSRLAERLRGWVSGSTSEPEAPYWPEEIGEPEPEYLDDSPGLVEIQVSVPPELVVSPEAAERFLSSLPPARHPISFELLGTAEEIAVRLSCAEPDAPAVRAQLSAHFPEAVLTEPEQTLQDLWTGEDREAPGLVVDFGLSHEFMLPLRTAAGFKVDPLVALAGALSELRPSELGLFQVLFQPVRSDWARSALRAATDWQGRPFFADAPEFLPATRRKLARPLFAAAIRAGARTEDPARSWEIVRGLAGALRQLADPAGNELIPLSNADYPREEHVADLLSRRSRRSGMLLNLEELVSLVHPPSASVRSPKLARERAKTKAAPEATKGHELVLGENVHAGITHLVTLSQDQRLRHMHVIGATGTGKSHLLLNLIRQDMEAGRGVGVLDPHGDLVDRILERVPEERISEIVLLDVGDEEYAAGLNLLQARSGLEKTLLASDLVAVFRRLATSWGDQMTAVLRNAILAFLESERGGTLADLRRFLVETDFRARHLATVTDPEVVYFWKREFPLLSGRPQAPLLTRLTTFLAPRAIRQIVSQRESKLDLGAAMDEGRIFLAKLAQGAVGEENASLLGSLLVSKFQQLTLARQAVETHERRPFYLYVDEFQHFVTPSMAQILSGARKYRLSLTLAHQDFQQLSGKSPEVASAVVTNPAVRVYFRVGHQDARRLAEGLSHFGADDLQRLGLGEAVCRVERADWDFNLRTLPLPKVDGEKARERRTQAVRLSQERYATPRAELDARSASNKTSEAPPQARDSRQEARKILEAVETPPKAPKAPQRAKSEAKAPPPAPPLGRGGPDHVYLQQLITRWAQSRGWRATVEKTVLDGAGRVDVALEREGWSVACEISVSSSAAQEVGNVEKCLEAGFDDVAVVSTERGFLQKAREAVSESLDGEAWERVRFLTPEELFALLEEREARLAGGEETVRGYKVETRFASVGDEERESRSKAISRVVARAVRRLRGKGE